MKFLFEYQDKSNKRHKGALNAPSRADAYALLRRKGIKPIRCDEAPGFFNSLFGKGKRWLAIGVLGSLCLVLCSFVLFFRKENTDLNASLRTFNSSLDATTRRQIIGDAAVIEKGIRTGWADVFSLEGDRFLASFAIPGVPAAVRSTTEEKLREALNCLPSPPTSTLSLEERQIRAIVSGMKDELKRFIAADGTIHEYGVRLVARQEQEINYYNLAQRDVQLAVDSGLPDAEVVALWEKRNASLRKMGIKLVSMPEESANSASEKK